MSNWWHDKVYDQDLALKTLHSKASLNLAKKEVAFLNQILSLSIEDQILDIPCGTGRHSTLFAKHGYQVTGIDINKALLKIAKDYGKKSNVSVNFKEGDMIKLSKFKNQFDVVLNLFSSFGYFKNDQENEKCLKQLINCLKPNGQLVIHLINRDWLLKVFRPVDWSETSDNFIMTARKYNESTLSNEANTIIMNKKTKKSKRYYHQMRLYSKQEMVDLLKKFDMKDIKVYGGMDGSKFSKYTSSHPVYYAKKS